MSCTKLPSFRALFGLAGAWIVACSPCFSQAADNQAPVPSSITVQPMAIDLRHQRQPHLLQVLGTSADGYSLDLHSQARFTSADLRIATVDAQGSVRPLANGQTQVTVSVAGQTRTVAVKVQLLATEPPYSFRHEVM